MTAFWKKRTRKKVSENKEKNSRNKLLKTSWSVSLWIIFSISGIFQISQYKNILTYSVKSSNCQMLSHNMHNDISFHLYLSEQIFDQVPAL